MSERLFLGLISGTSMDGVDTALVAIDGDRIELRTAHCFAYPDELRARLGRAIADPTSVNVIDLGRLDAAVGDFFGECAVSLADEAGISLGDVTAIGSHGQTIYHDIESSPVITQQIGDPNRIAEATGRPVVADLRRRDTAAGGQGAPLASALHAAVLRDDSENRAVLNLGGIANLTLLPAAAGQAVIGFDSGPASCLLDEWIHEHQGRPMDMDGRWAVSGEADDDLLAALLEDPYFELAPPKSTGREHFNLNWLRRYPVDDREPEDVQATLLKLTTETVARALEAWFPTCDRLLACGGGTHNPALMDALGERLPDLSVETTDDYGLDPDWVEAMLFAWLAERRLANAPGNLPEVTGAAGERVLGASYF
ncbi:MAG: anhydro-N-acetylmuramic acid kinase [Xanthomonadales bacterium]|nr:anhydro-N-acetylmuramic acid kinase [Xanthomonadales bacterium]